MLSGWPKYTLKLQSGAESRRGRGGNCFKLSIKLRLRAEPAVPPFSQSCILFNPMDGIAYKCEKFEDCGWLSTDTPPSAHRGGGKQGKNEPQAMEYSQLEHA
jgi:hypothetical protein